MVLISLVGKQTFISPARLAICAPIQRKCPSGQLLTWVPFALSKMKKTTLTILILQALNQLGRIASFGRTQGVRVPLRPISVVNGYKSGLSAHGQAHVHLCHLIVYGLPQVKNLSPLFRRIGLGDSWRLKNPCHTHLVRKFHLALVQYTKNGRST